MAQDYSQDVNGLGSPIMATLIPYQIAPEGDKLFLLRQAFSKHNFNIAMSM